MKAISVSGLLCLSVAVVSLMVVSSAAGFSSNPLFNPGTGRTLTAESTATSTLTAGAEIVICTSNHVVGGTISNALLVGGIVLHYLGCSFTKGEAESGCPANSVGASPGLILTNTLHGILGLLLPSGVTGILFLPVTSKVFTTFAKAEANNKVCGPETKVEGTVAASVEPVGTSQATGKINVIASDKPAIDLTHGLGAVTAKLTAFGETVTLVQSDNVTFSGATEVT